MRERRRLLLRTAATLATLGVLGIAYDHHVQQVGNSCQTEDSPQEPKTFDAALLHLYGGNAAGQPYPRTRLITAAAAELYYQQKVQHFVISGPHFAKTVANELTILTNLPTENIHITAALPSNTSSEFKFFNDTATQYSWNTLLDLSFSD